jgi:hypothetical protein
VGRDVTIVLAPPGESMTGVPACQLCILGRLAVRRQEVKAQLAPEDI